MAKRKRDQQAIVEIPPSPTVSPWLMPTAPIVDIPTRKRVSSLEDGQSIKIVWELADGSERWQKSFPITTRLVDLLPKATRHLHLDNGAAVPRLTHDRGDGISRDVYDDYDFDALRRRAMDAGQPRVVIKVHPPAGPSTLLILALPTPSTAETTIPTRPDSGFMTEGAIKPAVESQSARNEVSRGSAKKGRRKRKLEQLREDTQKGKQKEKTSAEAVVGGSSGVEIGELPKVEAKSERKGKGKKQAFERPKTGSSSPRNTLSTPLILSTLSSVPVSKPIFPSTTSPTVNRDSTPTHKQTRRDREMAKLLASTSKSTPNLSSVTPATTIPIISDPPAIASTSSGILSHTTPTPSNSKKRGRSPSPENQTPSTSTTASTSTPGTSSALRRKRKRALTTSPDHSDIFAPAGLGKAVPVWQRHVPIRPSPLGRISVDETVRETISVAVGVPVVVAGPVGGVEPAVVAMDVVMPVEAGGAKQSDQEVTSEVEDTIARHEKKKKAKAMNLEESASSTGTKDVESTTASAPAAGPDPTERGESVNEAHVRIGEDDTPTEPLAAVPDQASSTETTRPVKGLPTVKKSRKAKLLETQSHSDAGLAAPPTSNGPLSSFSNTSPATTPSDLPAEGNTDALQFARTTEVPITPRPKSLSPLVTTLRMTDRSSSSPGPSTTKINLSTPYNLYRKPSEPRSDPKVYSSSSFQSPLKGGTKVFETPGKGRGKGRGKVWEEDGSEDVDDPIEVDDSQKKVQVEESQISGLGPEKDKRIFDVESVGKVTDDPLLVHSEATSTSAGLEIVHAQNGEEEDAIDGIPESIIPLPAQNDEIEEASLSTVSTIPINNNELSPANSQSQAQSNQITRPQSNGHATQSRSPSPTPSHASTSSVTLAQLDPSFLNQVRGLSGNAVQAQKQRLAMRGECIICGASPTHLQKDCPVVKSGVEGLRGRLKVVQEEEGGTGKGKGKGKAKAKEEMEKEERRQERLEVIESWMSRLTKIKGNVLGMEHASAVESVSVTHEKETDHADTASLDALCKVARPAGGIEMSTSQADSPLSSNTHSPKTMTTIPPADNLPAIFLKAQEKAKLKGSNSVLSVSDAVIETEESESESDSGSDREMDSGSGSESDSGGGSDSSGTSSKSSSPTPSEPVDLQSFLKRPLSEKEIRKARISAAGMLPLDALAAGDDDSDASSVVSTESDDEKENVPPVGVSNGRRGSGSSIGDFVEEQGSGATAGSVEGTEDVGEDSPSVRRVSEVPIVQEEEMRDGSGSPRKSSSLGSGSGSGSRSFVELDEAAGESLGELPGDIALRQGIEEEKEDDEVGYPVLNREEEAPATQLKDIVLQVPTTPVKPRGGRNSQASQKASREVKPAIHPNDNTTALQNVKRSLRSASREIRELASSLPPSSFPTMNGLASPSVMPSSSLPVGIPRTANISPSATTRRRLRSASKDMSVAEEGSPAPPSPAVSTQRRRLRSISGNGEEGVVRDIKRSQGQLGPVPRESEEPVSGGETQKANTVSHMNGGTAHAEPSLAAAADAESGPEIVASQPLPTRRTTRFQSSQLDQLASSQPVNGDDAATEGSLPSDVHRSPLFMSNSQIQPTQAYNAYPSSISVETPAPAQSVRGLHGTSQSVNTAGGGTGAETVDAAVEGSGVVEREDQAVNGNGNGRHENESDLSDNDEEDDEEDDTVTTTTAPPITARVYPPLPRPSASQPTPSFPGLSSLPREILRQGKSFTSSQPVKAKSMSLLNGGGDGESSSESESDSDDEVAGDKRAKGRYANGKGKKGKKAPVSRGW